MKIFLSFLAFFTSINCFSQKEDYLVKTTGDTVWGNIKLMNNTFYVGETKVQEVNSNKVAKIKSSKYKGNIVIRCNLQLYTDNISELELDYMRKGVVDTVLILDEIYTTPKMNLYFVKNDYKVPFYFYKTPTDAQPIQLVIRYYLKGGLSNYFNNPSEYRGDKSRMNITEDKGYVNQLYAIMGKCKKIPPTMWELLSYRDYSFKQLIKKYNKCN